MQINKGFIFVFLQFLFFGLIFFTGPYIPRGLFLEIIFATGIILGATAVWSMRVSNFRVEPEVSIGSTLVKSGIYKYIRHPMYSGLILISLALVLNYFTVERLLLLVFLIINQYLKLSYEEKLLEKYFKNYKEYKKGTKKLIPFIY